MKYAKAQRKAAVAVGFLIAFAFAIATSGETREEPSATDAPPVQPKGEPPPSELVVLDIQADIDGSDTVTITPEGAKWAHKHWDWPSNVSINGVEWDPQAQPELASTGKLSCLTKADLSTARVIERSGRDTVAVETMDGAVTVYFADSPNGADRYEVKIAFFQRSK